MKKIIAVGLIAATLAAGTFAVNAADSNEVPSERGYGNMMERSEGTNREIDLNNEERSEWRNERHEERINKALENGNITEEEAVEFRAHFDEMKKNHEEDGFRGRNCHDRENGKKYGHGMNGNGMNRNSMNGHGMMRKNKR